MTVENTTPNQNSGKHTGTSRVGAPPPIFVCPLTMEIMDEPVLDQCAHSFERRAIVAWLKGGTSGHFSSCCCPISRKPLTVADLVPNHTLAEQIERWTWQHQQQHEHDNVCSETTIPSMTSSRKKYCAATVDTESSCHSETEFSHHSNDFHNYDDDDNDDEEIAMDRRRRHARLATKQQKRRVQYESIPAEFMLLPQERLALQLASSKEETAKDRLWRTQCCRNFLAASFLTLLLAVVVLVVIRRMIILDPDEET